MGGAGSEDDCELGSGFVEMFFITDMQMCFVFRQVWVDQGLLLESEAWEQVNHSQTYIQI